MSWNENYQALVQQSLINSTGIALGTIGFSWFGTDFKVDQGSEYNKNHSEAVVFFEMSGWTFFYLSKIMAVKTIQLVCKKLR